MPSVEDPEGACREGSSSACQIYGSPAVVKVLLAFKSQGWPAEPARPSATDPLAGSDYVLLRSTPLSLRTIALFRQRALRTLKPAGEDGAQRECSKRADSLES